MKIQAVSRNADQWIATIFSAKAAQTGGVVRRSSHWVAREIGREKFEQEVRQRGFHLLETGDQLIVVCHNGRLNLLF